MITCPQKKANIVSINKLNIEIYDDFEELKDVWDECCPTDDLYFSSKFFNVLKSQPPKGIENYFGLVRLGEEVAGVLLFQTKLFRLQEALTEDRKSIGSKLRHQLSKLVNIQGAGIGNSLLTGKYGIALSDYFSKEQYLEVIEEARSSFREYLRAKGIKADIFVAKDFFDHEVPTNVEDLSYTKYTVQPNMIFDLDQSWSSFADYQAAVTKKYRTRIKRARKKFAGLEKSILSTTDLEIYKSRMHELYRNVVNNASFNLFELRLDYFASLNDNLGQDFEVMGYFKEGELVAFSTLIHNGDHLDAHFLGYDAAANKEHQLYLNMLYDMVEYGVDHNKSSLIMSRTALEIKSSVGAKPHEMHLFVKHNNSVINWVLPRLLNYFGPDYTLVTRDPFGEKKGK